MEVKYSYRVAEESSPSFQSSNLAIFHEGSFPDKAQHTISFEVRRITEDIELRTVGNAEDMG